MRMHAKYLSFLGFFTVISLAVILSVGISACAVEKRPPLGGDRDSHGCIGSAGYTWCEAQQRCIRTWEEPCVAGEKITACYACEGLGEIRVEYYVGDGATVLFRGKEHQLKRTLSGSGARYEGDNILLWDKGGRAFFVLEGRGFSCLVKQCE